MYRKEEIVTQIKSTMKELDKLIARRKELEEQIQDEEKACFTILNEALEDLEKEVLD